MFLSCSPDFFLYLEALESKTTIRFSQSEVVLLSNLQSLGEKDKECTWEWLVNTDSGNSNQMNRALFSASFVPEST